MTSNSPRDDLKAELRRVLQHLYDWMVLYRSPLVEAFGFQRGEDSPMALRAALTEAIESFRPNTDVPSSVKTQRVYQLLHSRYMEQYTQQEVAIELGLSLRHLRREESQALSVLAVYLWHHYSLAQTWEDHKSARPPLEEEDNEKGTLALAEKQELEWVEESLPDEVVDVEALVEGVCALVSGMAQELRVGVNYASTEDLPSPVVKPTLIRQALSMVLTTIIRSAPGEQIWIRTRTKGCKVEILVESEAASLTSRLVGRRGNELEMARQLVELSGGAFEVSVCETRADRFTVRISLPAQEQIPVMVIDDNADALQLFQRYLSSSRYRFVGTSDPRQAMRLAEEISVQIIVLDVMLPGIDGWELLGRLREHPRIRDIPVIVCTILPHKQLALSLGAADFVQKPISRRDFLSVLDRQLASRLTGHH